MKIESPVDFQVCAVCIRGKVTLLCMCELQHCHSHLQLLCLIGEAFEEFSEEISGAVVNIRNKGDKLGLWTQDASRSEATKRIG